MYMQFIQFYCKSTYAQPPWPHFHKISYTCTVIGQKIVPTKKCTIISTKTCIFKKKYYYYCNFMADFYKIDSMRCRNV